MDYVAALRPTSGHRLGGGCTHPMLMTALFQVRLEGHQGSLNKVGCQSQVESISGIRIGNLPILSATCYTSVSLSPKPFEGLLIHTYLPTYIHTYIHIYLHTYIHTYIHIYIHTFLYLKSI